MLVVLTRSRSPDQWDDSLTHIKRGRLTSKEIWNIEKHFMYLERIINNRVLHISLVPDNKRTKVRFHLLLAQKMVLSLLPAFLLSSLLTVTNQLFIHSTSTAHPHRRWGSVEEARETSVLKWHLSSIIVVSLFCALYTMTTEKSKVIS